MAERLLALGAIAGATIYVLINALYVEFYDDFGLRPEDVGWDRLTVLSRAAWIALVGMAAAGLVGWIYAAYSTRDQRPPSGPAPAAEQRRGAHRHDRMRRLLGAASLAFAVLAPVGFVVVEMQIEEEAAEAMRGHSGDGISLMVPFIDVRATRATVTWLGEAAKRPSGLDSRHLMYLGRSRENVAIMACGRTTILVPAEHVVVHLMIHERNLPDAEQERRFEQVC